MATASRFPDCPFYEDNCFAFRKMGNSEKCVALADTYFKQGTKKCPFYKSKEQHALDLVKYPPLYGSFKE